jgi:PIN domain nuclease of toxin-antitoxin system
MDLARCWQSSHGAARGSMQLRGRKSYPLSSSISVYAAATVGIETDEKRRRGKQAVVMQPNVREWINRAVSGTRVERLEVAANIPLSAALYHSMYGDPFDRLVSQPR